ncbi:SseB family protein [Mycolicibacterium sp. Dal123E01]|uniref:SseB family protein n=1 Tax=Mycolicibacterium sp. Dal123E01 TaxID=3457578 RepID=UPI00403E9599
MAQEIYGGDRPLAVRNEHVGAHHGGILQVAEDLVTTLSKLPAEPAITYRGMSGLRPNASFTLSGIMPTSMDPRVASENFTTEWLAAIVSITGRLVAPFARYPEEQEIAMLPGTMLMVAGSVEVPGLPGGVVLWAEPGDAPGLPADSAALKDAVVQRVTAALARPNVSINSPGRYATRINPAPQDRVSTPDVGEQGSAMDPVDNFVVRKAVASFAAEPNQKAALEVLRSCMYGSLLLDTTGSDVPTDERFPGGSRLQIRRGTGPDGKGALLAFTRNVEIARLYPPGTQTKSMVNPSTGVLEFARSQQEAWLYIDPAGPTCALSAAEIDFAMRNPNNEPLKAAIFGLFSGRTGRQPVLSLLKQDGPLLLAVDETSVPGEARFRATGMPDGSPGLLVFTSAPEVVAYNPADAVVKATTGEVIERVRAGDYGGIVVNPAGPYLAVTLAELNT